MYASIFHMHIMIVLLELSEKLNIELSDLRVTYYQLKEEHQQLQDKMKFYNKVWVWILYTKIMPLFY